MLPRTPRSTLFPYTTLFRSEFKRDGALAWFLDQLLLDDEAALTRDEQKTLVVVWLLQNLFPALRRTRVIPACLGPQGSGKTDRKSTRLNSSHVAISYAVFCLNATSHSEIYTLSLHDALPI